MSSSAENFNKLLKVKIGVCKRLQKEVASYEKEVITQENHVQKMKDDGKDPYGKLFIVV
jgi:hypothetical protein